MERRVTKPASFGVKKTGYDALIKPHMSQWQKETMSDLHPMEHHGDRLPHEGAIHDITGKHFLVLAIIIISVIVFGVSA